MSETAGEPNLDDQLKQALKAFKKRLKVTRLDYESKMGYGPTTTGRSPIVGIMPPNNFPKLSGTNWRIKGKSNTSAKVFMK